MSKSVRKQQDETSRFCAWLTANGGEVLTTTNPFEVVRFRTSQGVCVIYRNAAGAWTSFTGALCQDAWSAFQNGVALRLNKATERRPKASILVRSLLDRDGPACFYCGADFSDDVPPTVEHLVSVTHRGPDHIANKFLACGRCNAEAGHMSAAEKIRLRDHKRRHVSRPTVPVHALLCEAA